SAGEVLWRGAPRDALGGAERRRAQLAVQMIFQDPYASLNPRMRVKDIVGEAPRVHGIVPRSEIEVYVEELLRKVGLDPSYKQRYPHQFSGGQRQRIGVARALAVRPELVVCDEAVAALDVSIQAQVLNLLKDLQGEFGLTYVFISHGLGAIKYISDRIVVMYLGKVMETATTAEIFARPRHPYTEILLDAYPEPDPHLRDRPRIIVEGDVPSPAKPPPGCVFHTRCPHAQEICKTEVPQLSTGVHPVACHFPLSAGER
ncbi:MAG TPA: oligopeptide/dipeptide ABC transporter ATP-binding protein, partial [Kribbella sp.]